MPYNITDICAEDALYGLLVAQTAGAQNDAETIFLKCDFFQINKKITAQEFQECIGDDFEDAELHIFVCTDGDIIIQTNNHKNAIDRLKIKILQAYGKEIAKTFDPEEFFHEYSFFDSIDTLKSICFQKQKKITRSSKELKKHLNNPHVLEVFQKTISLINMQRFMRSKPHILIVEDQAFSYKILMRAFKDYNCFVAEKAGDAIVQYMEKCPDIVLLDIDLPDFSGHTLASFINKIDPSAYIVMISANRAENDIN